MSNNAMDHILRNSRPGVFVQAIDLAARAEQRGALRDEQVRPGGEHSIRSTVVWSGFSVPATVAALLLTGTLLGVGLIAAAVA